MIPVSTIQTEAKSFLKNQTVSTQVLTWIYLSLSEILAAHDYWWNKKKTSFATVASTPEYILDHRIQGKQISWMGDEDNQTKEITECTLEQIYSFDSTPTDTGDVSNWAYVNKTEVQAITTSAGAVTVVSSSTADTSASVVIRGRVSSVERIETLALNGTTNVVGTLSFDADGIESITLTSECTGVITATGSTATLVKIPPGYLKIESPRVRLHYVPSEVLTIPYIFHQKPIKPSSTSDIIDIPDYAMDALLTGVEKYGHRNNGDFDLSFKTHEIFLKKIQDLWVRSKRELNIVHRKDFTRSGDKMVFTLPRTVTYTVT